MKRYTLRGEGRVFGLYSVVRFSVSSMILYMEAQAHGLSLSSPDYKENVCQVHSHHPQNLSTLCLCLLCEMFKIHAVPKNKKSKLINKSKII